MMITLELAHCELSKDSSIHSALSFRKVRVAIKLSSNTSGVEKGSLTTRELKKGQEQPKA